MGTLRRVKVLHTAVWMFFSGCIVAIPVVAGLRRFDWVGLLTGLVLVECLILALNRFRCPLTAVAARYTEDRRDNFDIYLPVCLARNNKLIFGGIFVGGEMFVIWEWWK